MGQDQIKRELVALGIGLDRAGEVINKQGQVLQGFVLPAIRELHERLRVVEGLWGVDTDTETEPEREEPQPEQPLPDPPRQRKVRERIDY